MLEPIRIKFTALSYFETTFTYVYLRLPRQTKFVNKHFITDLSVRLI